MGRQAEIAGIRALLRVGAVRVDFHVYNTEDPIWSGCSGHWGL
jgi:hypothetical protein